VDTKPGSMPPAPPDRLGVLQRRRHSCGRIVDSDPAPACASGRKPRLTPPRVRRRPAGSDRLHAPCRLSLDAGDCMKPSKKHDAEPSKRSNHPNRSAEAAGPPGPCPFSARAGPHRIAESGRLGAAEARRSPRQRRTRTGGALDRKFPPAGNLGPPASESRQHLGCAGGFRVAATPRLRRRLPDGCPSPARTRICRRAGPTVGGADGGTRVTGCRDRLPRPGAVTGCRDLVL
jgi:hypothetical protein